MQWETGKILWKRYIVKYLKLIIYKTIKVYHQMKYWTHSLLWDYSYSRRTVALDSAIISSASRIFSLDGGGLFFHFTVSTNQNIIKRFKNHVNIYLFTPTKKILELYIFTESSKYSIFLHQQIKNIGFQFLISKNWHQWYETAISYQCLSVA